MKKSLLLILLSIFSFAKIHSEITWKLSNDGTLTISGTNMPNYTCTYDINVGGIKYVNTPWYSQRNKIKKVVIENDVTNIGDYAFCKCSNLTSITIPNSVTSIGESAFLWCSSLTSITIPNSVTSIGKDAFCSSGLTSVNIGNSVTSIGDKAFAACSGLTSVTIPNSVTSIGEKAFRRCI